MPPSTRSRTSQTQLEDFAVTGKTKIGNDPISASSHKRKKPSIKSSTPSKKPKTTSNAEQLDGDGNEKDKITINRAAVLKLWAATVAQFVHPSISWHPTALSAGGAVSAICAISKGRAIGELPQKDEHKDDGGKKRSEASHGESLHVMHFKLNLDDTAEHAIVGGKIQKVSEESMKKSFGNEAYDTVHATFVECLQTWKGNEAELDKKAFGMYEKFRPTVAGWGKKGVLDMKVVKGAIGKPDR